MLVPKYVQTNTTDVRSYLLKNIMHGCITYVCIRTYMLFFLDQRFEVNKAEQSFELNVTADTLLSFNTVLYNMAIQYL